MSQQKPTEEYLTYLYIKAEIDGMPTCDKAEIMAIHERLVDIMKANPGKAHLAVALLGAQIAAEIEL